MPSTGSQTSSLKRLMRKLFGGRDEAQDAQLDHLEREADKALTETRISVQRLNEAIEKRYG